MQQNADPFCCIAEPKMYGGDEEMRPTNKIFPSGGFSSSLLMHTEQIENSDSIDSQYENEIMLDEFDLFVRHHKQTSHFRRCGASA
ncbi:hypothetical protein C6990_07770 [Nitrosopumilus sp. b3]|uniref:hypothetical protein n=1 Tax=Nitrosopumilus sp. b3 TaxID=2109909 RepID=UPI0015F5C1CC|nr:hypothetical protein [Nitrosopumilus sp. b3]KAF6246970.1 hypothetical protein C6990_07770 [Nitrosopumilus sp. b3]